jgi:hypothetical protein
MRADATAATRREVAWLQTQVRRLPAHLDRPEGVQPHAEADDLRFFDALRNHDPLWRAIALQEQTRAAGSATLDVWEAVAHEVASSFSGNTTRSVLNRVVAECARTALQVTGHCMTPDPTDPQEATEAEVLRKQYGNLLHAWVAAVRAETYDVLSEEGRTDLRVYRGMRMRTADVTTAGLATSAEMASGPVVTSATGRQLPMHVLSSFTTAPDTAVSFAKTTSRATVAVITSATVPVRDILGTGRTGAVDSLLGAVEEEVVVIHRDHQHYDILLVHSGVPLPDGHDDRDDWLCDTVDRLLNI